MMEQERLETNYHVGCRLVNQIERLKTVLQMVTADLARFDEELDRMPSRAVLQMVTEDLTRFSEEMRDLTIALRVV